MKLLIDNGADVNAPAAKRGGATALQFAAIKGFIPIARQLLQLGADVNAPASIVYGRTVLEGAAEHGRLDMVALLLAAGAGQKGKDERQFQKAIALAEERFHKCIVDLLKHYLQHGQIRSGFNTFEEFIDWDGGMEVTWETEI